MRNRLVALLMTGALTLGSAGTALADNGKGKGPSHGQSKFSANYKDWENNFWGNESLSRLILMGIMKGDGAGQIQSNKPVTRLEAAITVIRLLGLQKTNDPIQLDEEDQKETPQWGMEAVLIGLQHGFLEGGKGKLQPNKPLTRLEAAVLLVKAAGLGAEAEAEAGAALPFKDTQKLSGAAKGYLAIAIEKGFIRGMEDNTFKPEKPLTRAEWATMLDRLDRSEGPAVRPDGKQIKGEVVGVKTVDGIAALEVKTPVYPAGVVYKFDDAAVIYKERQEVTLDDVKAGDHVILQLSETRSILMLTLYTPAPSIQEAAGAVTAWTAPTGETAGSISFKPTTGDAKSLPVAANAAVKLGDNAGALADVRVGDQVKLTVTNGTVTAISIKIVKQELTGTLKAVTAGSATARPQLTVESGTPAASQTFEVLDWAELRKDGSTTAITFADLAVGQQVKLTVERNQVSKILVLQGAPTPSQLVTGQVMTWAAPTATADGSIVINPSGTELKLLPVLKTATVTLGENPVTLADVLVGDTATVSVTDGKVTAIKLQATAQEMTGTLTVVAAPSGGARAQLTFTTGTPAATQSLAVAPWATFKRQGSDAALTLADLVVGSTMKLTVVHNLVTKVEILTLPPQVETVSGQVSAWIAPTGSVGSMAITTNGQMTLFAVAPTATVALNGHAASFADVQVGDAVTLTVTDNAVTSIQVTALRAPASDTGTNP
ncbi:MAG TPA: S-layer homology domain-containing protein [Symbiobacteriaceae bacterium]|nr:S-layer homology domain-containing protein [Symbiobacteriaceae bacterium]